MSAAVIEADTPAAPGVPAANPWLIAILVAFASFMEVLDTTITNVALPYVAGGMGVSEDEASWVVTTYLVANAIILTARSYLARRLGRKTFFLISLGLFTLSSLLSGFARNLNALLLFRILQGVGGGGMVPVAQSILADLFPPAKRGQAFALFGVAVVVAPVVGPTLGGWLSDNVAWQWCFLVNVPVGVFAMAMIALVLREPKTARAEGRVAAREQIRRRRLHPDCDFPRRAGGRAGPRSGGRLVWFAFHRHVRDHLRSGIRADDSLGNEPPQSGGRPEDGGIAPIRRLLPGDVGDRRHLARDHAILCRCWCSRISATPRPGLASCSRRAGWSPW